MFVYFWLWQQNWPQNFSFSDLFKMYSHNLLDPDINPRTLQNKVQVDFRYYFVHRGCENIYNWTKDTFKVVTDDESGIVYVKKVEDKETKNHKETDNEIITAFMPEVRGSKLCPVMSFTTYLSALSTESNKLWQQARFQKFQSKRQDLVWSYSSWSKQFGSFC